MSDTLIAAIIGFVGGAILGPIINDLIARYREGRPHLRATLYVHDISTPTFLQTYLERGQSTEPYVTEKLEILSHLHSYMRLTLHNRGKEKTEAMTLTITYRPSHYLIQVDTQPELLRPNEGKVPIGYLPPGESCILHIWSDDTHKNLGYFLARDLFKITADKFYKLTFRFPFPIYLQDKIRTRVLISLLISGLLITLLNGFYWLFKIFITHEASF